MEGDSAAIGYMSYDYMGIYVISAIFMVIGMLVGAVLKRRMNKYARIASSAGLTGAEIARRMLADHDIHDVEVLSHNGFLTDHYNPGRKTVKLSQGIYDQPSVAAIAVAAHEVGHAVQHNKGYLFLKFRSAMVPVVNFSAKIQQWVILGGVLLINIFPYLLLAGIALFAATTLFSLVTLPVEFDASRRALKWLKTKGIAGEEYKMAKDGLKWAALTYVVAALQSVGTLLYYVMIFMGRRR